MSPTSATAFVVALLAAVGSSRAADVTAGPSVPNRAPLIETPFIPLPLGDVDAKGWLLKQLQLQRDGLTGHAEQVIPQLGPDSQWLGGTGKDADNWEKGPYYVKGLVSLAYTLDDPGLKSKAQKWIDWSIQSQRPDGDFGPASNDDWWPRMVMTYALRDYCEATNDPRVVPMLTKYFHFAAATLPRRPIKEWGKARAGDMIDTVYWLYNRTGDPSLLPLAELLHKQAYDWTDIFTNDKFLWFGDDIHPKHNVNVCQALKMPAVWYQQSKSPADRDAYRLGMANLLRGTTLPLDVPTGTEFLSGRSAVEGVEACSVVEKMLSDETVVAILGDPAVGDSLEKTAYNALPGAMTKDLRQYQYYTPTNEVVAVRGSLGFNQNYDDCFLPGPVSGFPCCCYNIHMGWPKFVQHAWMATADGGLVAPVYAPSSVRATLPGGAVVGIDEATKYPFDESVHFTVTADRPATFPLKLRIPARATNAMIVVNGTKMDSAKAGTFVDIRREWKTGDIVDVTLPISIRTVPCLNDSVAVTRGPLVYSLRMQQEQKIDKPGPDGFYQLSFTPKDAWNYGLVLDPAKPDSAFTFHQAVLKDDDFGTSPFAFDFCPVFITAKAKLLPDWTLTWNGRAAFDPPASPVPSDGPETEITLVPFGSQNLRVTAFPVIGDRPPAADAFTCEFTGPDATRWVTYGGGWYLAGGQFHTASNAPSGTGGNAGVKAVASGTDFADFTADVDVTTGDRGNAGLIFRVTKPSIGPDAYEGYYVGISPETHRLIAGKSSKSGWVPLAELDAPVPADKPVHLRIVAVGPTVTATIDGGGRLTFTDSDHKRGSIGVREYCTDPTKTLAAFGKLEVRAK